MNKKEILAVVYEMYEEYKKLDVEFLKTNHHKNIFYKGFCQWIWYKNYKSSFENNLIDQLKTDKIEFTDFTSHYWYETFADTQIFEITITPRIAHLERTIARLEKEIIKDTPAII